MNYTILRKLPPRGDLLASIPLSVAAEKNILQHQQEIKDILTGKDSRLLIIVGPCSAWPHEAVLQYAEKLSQLSEKVKKQLKIVMRVYVQKPRTITGWPGVLYQPDPHLAADIGKGMQYARKMLVAVAERGLPLAAESLYSHYREGFLELLSWVAIGARSSENQEHRIFASSLNIPVGIKNPTHGSLATAINSVVAAQSTHVTVLQDHEVKTHGNPYAHLVLRGGNNAPNYSIAHLEIAKEYLEKYQVQHPAIIIDANHDNAIINGERSYRLQPEIIFSVLNSVSSRPDLKALIKGFMLESFIKEGKQKMDPLKPELIDLSGLSITDACLGWEQTEEFLLALAGFLVESRSP